MKKVLFVILAIALCTTSSFAADVSLPSDLVQVEYLESTGKQYIDTEFKPNQNTRIVFTAKLTETSSTNWWYGVRKASAVDAFGLMTRNTTSTVTWFGTQSKTTTVPNFKEKVTVDQNKRLTSISYPDGTVVEITNNASTFTSAYNLFLCNISLAGSSSSSSFIGEIYSCQIYDDGVLVRDFIPCYRKTDSVAGLYDLVTNTFYTNAGTGEFLVGPEIIIPDVPDVPNVPDVPDVPTDSMNSMDAFFAMMSGIVSTMKTPMNIWGFAFSLWDVFMFSMVSAVIFGFIGKLFNM